MEDDLTLREIQTLELLARGYTNKRIARVLGISVKTVEAHLSHIYRKLGVKGRMGAGFYFLKNRKRLRTRLLRANSPTRQTPEDGSAK